jgi:hypothetical protein
MTSSRRDAAKPLTKDEARRIAANIAKIKQALNQRLIEPAEDARIITFWFLTGRPSTFPSSHYQPFSQTTEAKRALKRVLCLGLVFVVVMAESVAVGKGNKIESRFPHIIAIAIPSG